MRNETIICIGKNLKETLEYLPYEPESLSEVIEMVFSILEDAERVNAQIQVSYMNNNNH